MAEAQNLSQSLSMTPFRAVQTFGLAGMMKPEARIYHEVLFDLVGVGRVSDLFAARLKKALPDELSFRAMLLFGVLDSLRSVADGGPVKVECGLDSEKIGITISFALPPAGKIPVGGLKERILSGKGSERLEIMLHESLAFADRIYFKAQPSTGIVEICALSLRRSGDAARPGQQRAGLEVLILGDELGQAPPVAEYMALGDVDYKKLLRNSREAGEAAAPPTGEVLLHEAQDSLALLEAIRARKLKLEESSEGARKVVLAASEKEQDEEAIRVTGTTSRMDADKTEIRVDGAGTGPKDQKKVVLAASPKDESDDDSVRVLKASKEDLEAAGNSQKIVLKASEDGQEDGSDSEEIVIKASKSKSRKKGIFGRLLSMFTGDEGESGEDDGAGDDGEVEGSGDPAPASRPKRAKKPKAEGDGEGDEDDSVEDGEPAEAAAEAGGEGESQAGMRDIKSAAGDLEKELEQGSLSQIVEKIEKEAPALKSEIKNTKAEKWIEGLGAELLAERARLASMSKKLTQMVRQKELEFKNRENTLLQSVRSKDDALRTKTLQLMRMKDQVAKLQMSVERSKGATTGNEETAAKIKLTQTQRLLQSARSETEAANNKILEMKAAVEQMIEQRKQMITPAAHAELQKKADRLAKQVEDLKRAAAAAKSSDKSDAA